MPDQPPPEDSGKNANCSWYNPAAYCYPKIDIKIEPESDNETVDDAHFEPCCNAKIDKKRVRGRKNRTVGDAHFHPDCCPNIKNIKKELKSFTATQVKAHFDELRIKKEQIKFHDVVPQKSGCGDEKKPLLQFEEATTSTAKPSVSVACTSDFPVNKTATRKKPKRLFVRSVVVYVDDKFFDCESCNKKGTSNQRYSTHVRWHKRPIPYKCAICNMEFKYKTDLISHSSIHDGGGMALNDGKSRHPCRVCRRLPQVGKLPVDMHEHAGNKRNSCKICEKKFMEHKIQLSHEFMHSTRNKIAVPQ